MRKFIISMGVILIFTFLSACSSKPSVQLINSNVSIVNDKSKLGSIVITKGDKKGQELVPTALYYEFTIKNTGNRSIGSIEKDKGLKIKIVPNNELETTSKEVVGFNIFDQSSYAHSGVGYGHTFVPILKSGEEGKFVLNYELGVSKKDPEVPLMVPSAEKLKELQDNALNASLVIMLEDTEIARFNLMKKS